ncbi:unnamed protein product [Lota lota]
MPWRKEGFSTDCGPGRPGSHMRIEPGGPHHKGPALHGITGPRSLGGPQTVYIKLLIYLQGDAHKNTASRQHSCETRLLGWRLPRTPLVAQHPPPGGGVYTGRMLRHVVGVVRYNIFIGLDIIMS